MFSLVLRGRQSCALARETGSMIFNFSSLHEKRSPSRLVKVFSSESWAKSSIFCISFRFIILDLVAIIILLSFLMRTGMLRMDSVAASVAVTQIEEEYGPAFATCTSACLEHEFDLLSCGRTDSTAGEEEAQLQHPPCAVMSCRGSAREESLSSGKRRLRLSTSVVERERSERERRRRRAISTLIYFTCIEIISKIAFIFHNPPPLLSQPLFFFPNPLSTPPPSLPQYRPSLAYKSFIMSTAPKLTYAKIGNKSKVKVQPNSTELIRHQQQKSQDLFSHMNQQNLNYIKKELKLKKNRSEHDRTRINRDEEKEELQDQITQREKIYHKYKGEEQVSEREPYLEETERRSSEEKPLEIQLSEDAEYLDNQLLQEQYKMDEKKQLSISQKEHQKGFTKNQDNNKMYHSLPYEQPKKRVVSIQGYFRQSVSTHLQKHKQDGNFIELLDDYISDLNHSKHLKSRAHDESIDKKQQAERQERGHKYTKESLKQSTHRKVSSESEERIKEELKKIERLKRNSDTFGQPNSKYTNPSNLSYDGVDLQMRLKKEQLSCIMLAKEIESLREALIDKDKVIKKLRLSNELLEEQITHLKAQQEIIMKNKHDYTYEDRPNRSQKHTKRINDQNLMQDYDGGLNQFILSHQRHGSSVNPNPRNGYSYRGSSKHLKEQDLQFNQPLFHQFAPSTNSKPNPPRTSTPRKDRSIERLQQQYQDFILQTNNHSRKGDYRYK